MADGRTLVAFCPMDGRVSWFDLERMTVTKEIVVSQQNPFWTTPVFSPDGKTLYLDEGGTGRLTVVDLTNRTIVRSMRFAAAGMNPLAWLGSLVVIPAYAGGIPRTAALSPDGTWLYAAGAGVSLVRVPDLSVRGRWVPDVSVNSVWASPDGQTIYVLSRGDELHALRTDGSQVAKLGLPANTYGFIVPTIP
jgi:DNA-binding beta-propeller fold protein YncE